MFFSVFAVTLNNLFLSKVFAFICICYIYYLYMSTIVCTFKTSALNFDTVYSYINNLAIVNNSNVWMN